jgi:hypothetical protein
MRGHRHVAPVGSGHRVRAIRYPDPPPGGEVIEVVPIVAGEADDPVPSRGTGLANQFTSMTGGVSVARGRTISTLVPALSIEQ